jgi:hypothetical protein
MGYESSRPTDVSRRLGHADDTIIAKILAPSLAREERAEAHA